MIRVAFFDSKPYDMATFKKRLNQKNLEEEISFEFFDMRLSSSTMHVLDGRFQAVCAFVNDTIDAEVIQHFAEKQVRLICLRCAGFNNVDCSALEQLKQPIPLLRVPSYSPHAVAEHALSLICALNRKTHKAFNRVREGNFSLDGLLGFDLHGKIAGVVGTGKIGQSMVKILNGLGMHVLAYDPYPQEGLEAEYVNFESLCRRADIISLHCPLSPQTQYIINSKSLSWMQKHAILINTSRGALINTSDLISALKKGAIGAAGLDVYEEEEKLFFEYHSSENLSDEVFLRLMSFNNVLVTSHQAFLTHEALSNIADTTIDNIWQYFSQQQCQNQVVLDS